MTRWSLPRLARHLAGEGIEISPRHLGTLLAEAGLSFQPTRTWKASPDPDSGNSVLGVTMNAPQLDRGSNRLAAANNVRSAEASCGRCTCRRKTASSCRSTTTCSSLN